MTGNSPSVLLAACGLLRDTRKDVRHQSPLPPAPVAAAPPLQARQGFPTSYQSFDETLGSNASSSSTPARKPWSDKISRRTPISSSSSSSAGSLPEAGLDAGSSTRPARPPKPPKPSRKAPWPEGPVWSKDQSMAAKMAAKEISSINHSSIEPRDIQQALAPTQRTITVDSPRVFEEMVNATCFTPSTNAVRSDFPGTAQSSDVKAQILRPHLFSWPVSPKTGGGSPQRNSAIRASGVVQALTCIIQELTLVKYGVAIDSQDLNRKISSHCRGSRNGESADYGVLSPVDVVHEFNLRSSDLRFRTHDVTKSLALHIESRMIASFQELQAEVRRMPGTSRTLAVVAPLSLDLRSVADEERQARAIAVFREDYGRPTLLVGRDVEPGSQAPLNCFSAANLRCAMLVDPIISKVFCHETAIATPSLREEYASLGIMLLPEESTRTCPPRTEVAHIAVYPWHQILEAAQTEEGGPAPTQRWMWRMRRVVEHPDASPEVLLQLLTQVATWLQGGGNTAADVQIAVSSAGLPPGLILLIQRFLLEHTEPKSPTRRVELSIIMQICRIVALSSKGCPECAAAFTQTHTISTLCCLMQRWPENGDIQLDAINAIDALIEENSQAAALAGSSGAAHWARVASNMHPRHPEIQRSGTRALQHLSSVPLTDVVPVGESNAINKTHDENDAVSRKGLAEALMEKRAADAVAQPGIVSTAVGWLFSGRQRGNASTRQGNKSEPPGHRTSHQKIDPARHLPPSPALAVPRLELASVPRMAPAANSECASPGTTGASAITRVGESRRATSRPAPMVSTKAHDDGMSPREDSPMAPSVVRSMHRWGDSEVAHSAQVPAHRPLNSPRMRP